MPLSKAHYHLFSSGSTYQYKKLSWHDWKIIDWDIKHRHKQFDTIKLKCSIVYIAGAARKIYLTLYYFCPCRWFQWTLMKCSFLQHFIWVFSVCKYPFRGGGVCIQRVNIETWPRGHKTWVHHQTRNKTQAANQCTLFWVWDCTHVL